MGWPADKQAQTNTNLMQSGSEPPLERGERLDTEFLLQPISSFSQYLSHCCHCQVSGASHCSEWPLPFTPCHLLLGIFQIAQPGSPFLAHFRGPGYSWNLPREHSQAPWLSLVRLGPHHLSLSNTAEMGSSPICSEES